MLKDLAKDLILRPIKKEDIPLLWELRYKEKLPEWKKWDAPYYELVQIPYEEYLANSEQMIKEDNQCIIEVDGKIIGTVIYYWEHKASNWLEMGIVIYDSNYWNGGYGTKALSLWIDRLFTTLPLVRVGYSTWSGNERMIKVGEKLGMTMEAKLRKCRLYNGVYYDSIRMGLLREEWENSSNRI